MSREVNSKLELEDKHFKPRAVLAVVFLAFAVAMITYGVISLLSVESGWRTIEPGSNIEGSCGTEFIFQYNIGYSGISAGQEYRQIKAVYEQAVKDATMIFSENYYTGVNNIYTINHNPNSEIVIEGELYRALELLQKYGRREHYLAPVYAEYSNLFFCVNDTEAANFDPYINGEVREWMKKAAAYADDENSIELQLLGDNRVRLYVSEEYLKFAYEYYITDFIDLYWMKNAFIADYLAEVLIRNGYTYGSLSSFDGYVRNLDSGAHEEYGFNIFDRELNIIYPAAQMNYSGSMSIVYLRDYIMNDLDESYYYETGDGGLRHKYIDVRDGLCKAAVDSLVGYSQDKSCAEVLMNLLSVYIADEFDPATLVSLTESEIDYVYCGDFTIYFSGDYVKFTSIYDKGGVKYGLSKAEW